jgi:hypothetical protein
VRQHVSPDVDAGRDLQQAQPVRGELEDGALGVYLYFRASVWHSEFVGAEELAYGILDAAAGTGLRVPQDLSVVTWEVVGAQERTAHMAGASGAVTEAPAASRQSSLTGVHLPIWDMGRAAALLAASLSRGAASPSGVRQVFPTTLQPGSTTGLARVTAPPG